MRLADLDLLALGNTIQISGVMYSGQGKTFLVYLPGEREDFPTALLELSHDDWKAVIRQTDLQETMVLAEDTGGLKKIIMRKSTRTIEQGVSWRVYKRDGYACRYCGADDVPLTVDHLIPWEDGGPTIEANLVTACRKCNKTRGTMPLADWLNSPYMEQRFRHGLLTPYAALELDKLVGTLKDIPLRYHVRSR